MFFPVNSCPFCKRALFGIVSKSMPVFLEDGISKVHTCVHVLLLLLVLSTVVCYSCPVCRYCQTPEEVADSRCMKCGSQEVHVERFSIWFDC